MREDEVRFRRYIVHLAIFVAVICGSTLTLNFIIDPLWYHGGNKIFAHNYSFDERTSKTNLLLHRDREYDCLILGSSRTTLLNGHWIEKHDCFNYAFSLGNIEEFIEFARYAREVAGLSPRLVIVGVDAENLVTEPLPTTIPSFVRNSEAPRGSLLTYLSIDAADFSIRTLLRNSPVPRYYTGDFSCLVLPDAPDYEPLRETKADEPNGYSSKRKRLFADLKRVFPGATLVGYVPPVSAWEVAKSARTDALGEYLEAMFEVAKVFDEFYDFSPPSFVTSDRDMTYDGSHYYPQVNMKIARAISRSRPAFGLDVKALDARAYRHSYQAAVQSFINRHLVRAYPAAR